MNCLYNRYCTNIRKLYLWQKEQVYICISFSFNTSYLVRKNIKHMLHVQSIMLVRDIHINGIVVYHESQSLPFNFM